MIPIEVFHSILERPDPALLEKMTKEATRLTRQFFGRQIALYTPIYLDNHCDGGCTYCGFNRNRDIVRIKLTSEQIATEMEIIAGWGIDHILLLTGESPQSAPISYLLAAVRLAHRFFSAVSLEVYPLEEDGYRQLVRAGADGAALYQETYNRTRYSRLHPCGQKADFDYRYRAPERMAHAGMRRLTLGVLLGLTDPAADLHALFSHLEALQYDFPGIEYQLAFPRLQPLPEDKPAFAAVSDQQLLSAIALARLLFPRVAISLSTREPAAIRDLALESAVTCISAGSRTDVGGYATAAMAPVQFAIRDHRSVVEIVDILKVRGFNPAYTNWRSLGDDDE